jgi:hypothetical protein
MEKVFFLMATHLNFTVRVDLPFPVPRTAGNGCKPHGPENLRQLAGQRSKEVYRFLLQVGFYIQRPIHR